MNLALFMYIHPSDGLCVCDEFPFAELFLYFAALFFYFSSSVDRLLSFGAVLPLCGRCEEHFTPNRLVTFSCLVFFFVRSSFLLYPARSEPSHHPAPGLAWPARCGGLSFPRFGATFSVIIGALIVEVTYLPGLALLSLLVYLVDRVIPARPTTDFGVGSARGTTVDRSSEHQDQLDRELLF